MFCTGQFADLFRLNSLVILPLSPIKVTTGTPCLMSKVVGLLCFLQHLTIRFLEELRRVHLNASRLTVGQHTLLKAFRREGIITALAGFCEVGLIFLQHRIEVDRHTIHMFLGKEHTGKA